MLGLIITTMVLGALGGVVYAVATGWKDTESSFQIQVYGGLSVSNIQRVVRPARLTGTVRAGSVDGSAATKAALMLWTDANNDGVIQFPETALLEHDGTGNTIEYHTVQFPSTWTDDQKAWVNSWPVTETDLQDPAMPETFLTQSHSINPNVKPVLLAKNVPGAKFWVHNAGSETQREIFEFVLTLTRDGQSDIVYSAATLRGSIAEDEDI